MEQLSESMKILLASTFSLYLKTHFFHWNVEGVDFYQFHKLFQEQYEEIYDTIDVMAEKIRTLDAYAPGSFSRYMELSAIDDAVEIPATMEMIGTLLIDHTTLIELLTRTFSIANSLNKQDIANYIAERLDAHNKHIWMLRSTIR